MVPISQIHKKHINTLFAQNVGNNGCFSSKARKTKKYPVWQNVELLAVKLAVHIVTTGLYSVKYLL